MRKCEEIRDLMTLYYEDELDDIQRKEFEYHTRSCADCKIEYTDFLTVVNICESVGEEELPGDFKKNLHEKLLVEKGRMLSRNITSFLDSNYIKIITSVAAILLVAFIAKDVFIDKVFYYDRNKMVFDATRKNSQTKAQQNNLIQGSPGIQNNPSNAFVPVPSNNIGDSTSVGTLSTSTQLHDQTTYEPTKSDVDVAMKQLDKKTKVSNDATNGFIVANEDISVASKNVSGDVDAITAYTNKNGIKAQYVSGTNGGGTITFNYDSQKLPGLMDEIKNLLSGKVISSNIVKDDTYKKIISDLEVDQNKTNAKINEITTNNASSTKKGIGTKKNITVVDPKLNDLQKQRSETDKKISIYKARPLLNSVTVTLESK